jgi:hypothetical protein
LARPWIAPVALLLLLGACSNNSALEWTEDVKLPDGRVVTLERYVEFKGGASQLGEPSTESMQRFKFRHPMTGEEVRWESTKEKILLKTVALWFELETPMLLTEPAYMGEMRRLNCPSPPYMLYAYTQGQWTSRSLSLVGIDRIRSNLTTHPLDERKRIESNQRRKSAVETADSYAFRNGTHRVPYVLRFKNMPTQTFDEANCNRPTRSNDMLESERQ